MHSKRKVSPAAVGERLRPAMPGAFPPISDIPAAMRALLAELDVIADHQHALEQRCTALIELTADEERGEEAASSDPKPLA